MKIRADLHTHSSGSGHAYSSIDEMALSARKKGLKILAITDHAPKMPGGAHEYYFYNLRVLPEYLHGVRILRGAEVNIVSAQGQLDLSPEMLAMLDVVVASAHAVTTPENLTKKQNTAMYLKVIANPHVDILGHLENPIFELDYEPIIAAAQENGKIVEINNASFTVARHGSYNNCIEIMRLLKERHMPVVINSDAHVASRVGEVSRAMEIALEQGIKKENILNLNARKTAAWLQVKL
jgi:putative hydrolase